MSAAVPPSPARAGEGRSEGQRTAIAITVGEPAGIGPELLARLAERHRERAFAARLVAIGDRPLLDARAARCGIAADYATFDPTSAGPAHGIVEVWHVPLAAPVTPGAPDPVNARAVLATLDRGADACATGAFAALVTGPVQKSVMQDAGIAFSGHTEHFAHRTRTRAW
jgi:4-hydroxythreonine-4-phosphate dehydrogenase